MARNIEKVIEEFNSRYGNEDMFSAFDVVSIKEMSSSGSANEVVYNAIINALKAGYVLGYKKALRDAKKQTIEN